jgi:hypothetical protein
MLNGEMEIIQFKQRTKKIQFTLTFETNKSGLEIRTNPITIRKNIS